MKATLLLLGLILSTSACAASKYQFSQEQLDAINQVKVLKVEPDLNNCQFVTPIEIWEGDQQLLNVRYGSYSQAIRMAQFEALKAKANVLIIDKLMEPASAKSPWFELKGRAFDCN